MHAVGTSVTPSSVCTSRRVLTNWFGNSAKSSLLKTARSFKVPVVVSIWLSSASNCRCASFVCAGTIIGFDGQHRVLAKLGLRRDRGYPPAMVKITVIGCNWVMHHQRIACSSRRRPRHEVARVHEAQADLPVNGAVI